MVFLNIRLSLARDNVGPYIWPAFSHMGHSTEVVGYPPEVFNLKYTVKSPVGTIFFQDLFSQRIKTWTERQRLSTRSWWRHEMPRAFGESQAQPLCWSNWKTSMTTSPSLLSVSPSHRALVDRGWDNPDSWFGGSQGSTPNLSTSPHIPGCFWSQTVETLLHP